MDEKGFLMEVRKIEQSLLARVPSYEKRRGLSGLLQKLVKRKVLSSEKAGRIMTLWQLRNQIENPHSSETKEIDADLLREVQADLETI